MNLTIVSLQKYYNDRIVYIGIKFKSIIMDAFTLKHLIFCLLNLLSSPEKVQKLHNKFLYTQNFKRQHLRCNSKDLVPRGLVHSVFRSEAHHNNIKK